MMRLCLVAGPQGGQVVTASMHYITGPRVSSATREACSVRVTSACYGGAHAMLHNKTSPRLLTYKCEQQQVTSKSDTRVLGYGSRRSGNGSAATSAIATNNVSQMFG